jgi:hypothetical protein
MDAHERQEDVPHECIDVGYVNIAHGYQSTILS